MDPNLNLNLEPLKWCRHNSHDWVNAYANPFGDLEWNPETGDRILRSYKENLSLPTKLLPYYRCSICQIPGRYHPDKYAILPDR